MTKQSHNSDLSIFAGSGKTDDTNAFKSCIHQGPRKYSGHGYWICLWKVKRLCILLNPLGLYFLFLLHRKALPLRHLAIDLSIVSLLFSLKHYLSYLQSTFFPHHKLSIFFFLFKRITSLLINALYLDFHCKVLRFRTSEFKCPMKVS